MQLVSLLCLVPVNLLLEFAEDFVPLQRWFCSAFVIWKRYFSEGLDVAIAQQAVGVKALALPYVSQDRGWVLELNSLYIYLSLVMTQVLVEFVVQLLVLVLALMHHVKVIKVLVC